MILLAALILFGILCLIDAQQKQQKRELWSRHS